VPHYRIKVESIASVWEQDAEKIKGGLLIGEKSVPSMDQDTVTIAVAAAKQALAMAGLDGKAVGAVYVGSESHPYTVKSSAAIVGEAINATHDLMAADLEFACKAGTAAVQICMGLVGAGYIDYGMAIGADTSQGRPGDALEYTAAAGGAAFIIGKKDCVADIDATTSFTTDTPDFWRREGEEFPTHAGRFTGEPAYFKHIIGSVGALMEKVKSKPGDYDYFVPHQPNGKFPRKVAKKLGFTEKQLMPSILVDKIGNTYSGSSPLALVNVLDQAKPGDRILMASYGSGSGSDAFDITVTDRIKEAHKGQKHKLKDFIEKKQYIDYGTYAKFRRKLKGI